MCIYFLGQVLVVVCWAKCGKSISKPFPSPIDSTLMLFSWYLANSSLFYTLIDGLVHSIRSQVWG